MGLRDTVNYIVAGDERLTGIGVMMDQISGLSLDMRHRQQLCILCRQRVRAMVIRSRVNAPAAAVMQYIVPTTNLTLSFCSVPT